MQINGDAGCFGPGYRANAVIGRALRLVIRNMAGLIPGEMDKATLSTPGRYSFCFAENEARSPWEPRHVELGFAASASTVTLTAVRLVYPVMESTSATGEALLQTLVEALKTVGIANYYQIGTGAKNTAVIFSSDQNGSYANVTLAPELLNALKAGSVLNIGLETVTRNPLTIPVSLTGFTSAVDRLANLK